MSSLVATEDRMGGRFDYGGAFGARYHEARRLPEQAQQWISRARGRKLSPWISPADRVLEYGVGFGWNLACVSCAEKVGYDLTQELRPSVEAHGIRFEAEARFLEPEGYDVIVAHHVLEHVRNPAESLGFLRTLVRASGKLLLFVPYERERKYQRWDPANGAHHLSSWTPSSLLALVGTQGWTAGSVALEAFRFDRAAALLAARMRGGYRLFSWLRAVAVRLFPEYELRVVVRPRV